MSAYLFCRIVQKEIPSQIVFESSHVLAFRDLHPRAPVHVLIIPKQHAANWMELPSDPNVLIGLHEGIQSVAKLEKVDASGFRLVVNNGADAGQEVKHLHIHLLAGRTLVWPPG